MEPRPAAPPGDLATAVQDGRKLLQNVESGRCAGRLNTRKGTVSPSASRHTGISRLANHPGVPLVHVRDFAGHVSLATTQSYVHKIEDATVAQAMQEALG